MRRRFWLGVSPEWNEVPNLMMENQDVLLKAEGYTKRKRDEVALSGENGRRRKMISDLRNLYIRPKLLGGHKIQRGSLLKIGMKFSRKKVNGKCKISVRESHRWCFLAEV